MATVPDAGTWYAGINGDDAMECKFTLSINKFDCPLNCSGRGRCIHNTNGTHTCLCDEVRTVSGVSCLVVPLLTLRQGACFSCSGHGHCKLIPLVPACVMRCQHCLCCLSRVCVVCRGLGWPSMPLGKAAFDSFCMWGNVEKQHDTKAGRGPHVSAVCCAALSGRGLL